MGDRDLAHRFREREARVGEPVLVVEDWSVYHPLHTERQVIKNVDFQVRRGEGVGIAGLMGAGRTEFPMSLFGRAWGRGITRPVPPDDPHAHPSNVSAAVSPAPPYISRT